MEDQRKHRTTSDKHSDENILELTKEMALSNQDDGDIIDLTKNIDDPDAPSSAAAPAAPAREAQAPPVKPDPVAPVKMEPPREIEEEVDAAFETVQSEPGNEKREPVPDEQLFDNLTEITARVDEAVGEHESAGAAETEKSPAPDPAMSDDDAIAADAAVVEAAMGEEPSEQEEAEPVDVVGAGDRPAADDLLENEEIIELTDIVDPAELEQAALADMEQDEEDILELTDIVDPAEFAAETEDIPPTTEIVDPGSIEVPADEAPAQWVKEAAADEPDETPAVAAEEPESAESTEIADMFMDEMMPDEITAEENADPAVGHVLDAALPLADDPAAEEEEQVIQLSDVLGQTDTQEHIPIEEIKMGAEEDLAAEPVSLEREDAANALGLNLEMQQKIEAAVKHLLETKYADSFQRLIADAVEKAVAEQVNAIKRSLRDDDDAKV